MPHVVVSLVVNDMKKEVIVSFVDIVDHHCLK